MVMQEHWLDIAVPQRQEICLQKTTSVNCQFKFNWIMKNTVLSNIQVELLQMFKYNLPESQLMELKKILCEYFAKVASDEADKLWDKKQLDRCHYGKLGQ